MLCLKQYSHIRDLITVQGGWREIIYEGKPK